MDFREDSNANSNTDIINMLLTYLSELFNFYFLEQALVDN